MSNDTTKTFQWEKAPGKKAMFDFSFANPQSTFPLQSFATDDHVFWLFTT